LSPANQNLFCAIAVWISPVHGEISALDKKLFLPPETAMVIFEQVCHVPMA
jgi:hypothetical protein